VGLGVQVPEDALHRVVQRLGLEEAVLVENLEAATQRGQRLVGLAHVVGQRLEAVLRLARLRVEFALAVDPVVVQEVDQPFWPQPAAQRIDRAHLRLAQVEDALQHLQILWLHLVVADGHGVIGVGAAPPAGLVVQGEDLDPAVGEDLFQPLDLGGDAFAAALPAVLVVHVEDQVDRHPFLDDAGQQQPAEEGLAGAAFAEDARRALHQPLQAERHLDLFHVQRLADVEEMRLALGIEAFCAEDLADLLLAGWPHGAEVAGHRLDRPRLAVFVQHQHRAEMHQAKGADASMHRGQEVVAHVGRVEHELLAGRAQLHIGDHAEEAFALAAHHRVAAHSQLLGAPLALQPHSQPLGQRAADDHAQALGDGLLLWPVPLLWPVSDRATPGLAGAGQRVELGVEGGVGKRCSAGCD